MKYELGNDKNECLINEIIKQYNLPIEAVHNYDLEMFDENVYHQFIANVLKYPIVLIIFNNYQKASYLIQKRIDKIIELGYCYDKNGSIVYLNNSIFVFCENIKQHNFGYIS